MSSNVLYLIFAKAEPQPFDKVDDDSYVEIENKDKVAASLGEATKKCDDVYDTKPVQL